MDLRQQLCEINGKEKTNGKGIGALASNFLIDFCECSVLWCDSLPFQWQKIASIVFPSVEIPMSFSAIDELSRKHPKKKFMIE